MCLLKKQKQTNKQKHYKDRKTTTKKNKEGQKQEKGKKEHIQENKDMNDSWPSQLRGQYHCDGQSKYSGTDAQEP